MDILRQCESCAAIRHNSKDLLNYFIDKLRLGSVTKQIRLPQQAYMDTVTTDGNGLNNKIWYMYLEKFNIKN